MEPDRAVHWMRRLREDRRPALNVFVDCEAYRVEEPDGGERHVFACAGVAFSREGMEEPPPIVVTGHPTLWETVTDLTERDRTARVWIYNAEYDVRLSHALRNLGYLGWEVRRFALDDRSCWISLARGRHRLTICDARSFLPGGMDAIADALEVPRPPLGDDLDDLRERARWDVDALRGAVMRHLYPFLDDQLGGSLQVTGPGQAMAAYRRRFLPERTVLVHEWEDVLGAERAAAWTGRAEAWRWGEHRGPWTEFDYTLAYPRLCIDQPLPCRYLGPGPLQASQGRVYAVLAHCDVETRVPVLPAHTKDGETVWGTGRFTGWYWDREIQLARRCGAAVHVRDEHVYECAPVLSDWARWVSGVVLEHPSPIIRRLAKQWARALIGRFSLRYPSWEEYAEGLEEDELVYSPGWSNQRGCETAYLVVGGVMWERVGEQESSNSVPALTSYITSLGRVRIWETMVQAGLENVAYVDTDSVITNAKGARRLRAQLPDGLRVKGVYDRIAVLGTRALILDGNPRVAGLPRGAEHVGGEEWVAETWDGPSTGRLGALETVRTRHKGFTLSLSDGRRERASDGVTAPIRLDSWSVR